MILSNLEELGGGFKPKNQKKAEKLVLSEIEQFKRKMA